MLMIKKLAFDPISGGDLIGEFQCKLSQIVGSMYKKISGDLRNKKPKYKYPSYGTITVEATPLVMSSGVLALNCSGKKIG